MKLWQETTLKAEIFFYHYYNCIIFIVYFKMEIKLCDFEKKKKSYIKLVKCAKFCAIHSSQFKLEVADVCASNETQNALWIFLKSCWRM